MNWFIVEQLRLIDPARYAEALGHGTVGDLVRHEVLRLSYTAHDLAAFARDLGDVAPRYADIDFIDRQPFVLVMNAATSQTLVLPGRAASD